MTMRTAAIVHRLKLFETNRIGSGLSRVKENSGTDTATPITAKS